MFTRRQRVQTALNHIQPDRVPCDFTVTVKPYVDLCSYLNINEESVWWDEWGHAFPLTEVLEKLNVDVFHIPFGITAKGWFDQNAQVFQEEWGYSKTRIEDKSGGFLYQIIDSPLKDAKSVKEILSYDWPNHQEERLEGLKEYVKNLYMNTDFALTMTFGGHIFEYSHYLRGMENFFIDLIKNPDMACAMMDKILEIQLYRDRQILREIGKYLTYFRFNGEDLGSQAAPLISPDLFRKHVKSRLETEWRQAKDEFLKQNPDGKIAVHSCGAIYDFIDDFIEMGADILNPLQPNAAGMDTARIKNTFGNRLSFHGGIETQNIISKGNVLDITLEVKKRIEDLAAGGGYIMAPSHNFQSGISPQKIIAMYEASQDFGKYL